MARLVREFIEIKDHASLDGLIQSLIEARDSLPSPEEAEVKMRGDDVFGRRLSISFRRPQTAEEAECDARYANAYRESREKQQAEHMPQPRRTGRLRIVA